MSSYIRQFVAAFVALLLLVVGFTYLIDPYDYWNSPKLAELNRYKPAVGKHFAIVKQRQYDRIHPVTLIAGNSRVEGGFDPASSAWPAAARPVYNLGMPGTGLPDVVDAVLDAIDRHRPQRIYIGVDAMDFLVTEQTWRNFRQAEARAAEATIADRAQQLAQISLSIDALMDSGATILEQNESFPEHTTAAGFNGLFHYPNIVAAEGHAVLFAQRKADNASRLTSTRKAVIWPGPGGNASLAALDRLAAECRARGIELVAFTYPYHAELLDLIAKTGLASAIDDWRGLLAAWSARNSVTVWDFTHLNAVTTEPVPPAGDTQTRMQWYWELGHFKPSLGDRLIKIMVGADSAGDLGNRLVPMPDAISEQGRLRDG